MASNATADPTPFQSLRPDEMLAGDTVRVGAQSALVVTDPLLVHRGLGLFDEMKLLAGTYLQFADSTKPRFWTFELTDRLEVQRSDR